MFLTARLNHSSSEHHTDGTAATVQLRSVLETRARVPFRIFGTSETVCVVFDTRADTPHSRRLCRFKRGDVHPTWYAILRCTQRTVPRRRALAGRYRDGVVCQEAVDAA